MDIKELVATISSRYEERDKYSEKFYKEKLYSKAIDKIGDKYIDTECDNWDCEMDELFNFLYNNAFQLITQLNEEDFEDIYVKYQDDYIRIFEMHGQGCYRLIEKTSVKPTAYVKYEDIVIYCEEGIRPYKANIMDVLMRSLDTLETALSSDEIKIENETLQFSEIKKYLINNLK